MRPLSRARVPDGMLAVATARDLSPDSTVMVADFLDVHALAFRGHVLGVDRAGAVRFGKRPLRMVDGVWVMREDPEAQRGSEDVRAAPEDLSMVVLE